MGVRSSLVARRGQQVVAGDRLADRIGIGVLAKVFPPELVDRVVDEAGVRERRTRTLPSRVVLFFQSGYGEVWNKLVAGLDWARQFRVRLAAGMQPSPAAVTYARQRLGWQVMAALMEAVAGPLAGKSRSARSWPGCGWWPWTGCAWTCRIPRRTGRSSATRAMTPAAARSRRSA